MTETFSITQRADGTYRLVHRQRGWTLYGETKADVINQLASEMKSAEFDGEEPRFDTAGVQNGFELDAFEDE